MDDGYNLPVTDDKGFTRTVTSPPGAAITMTKIEMPQYLKDSIARGLELGHEWRKGYNEGAKDGRMEGLFMGVVIATLVMTLLVLALGAIMKWG
jgi:hypothetical protein